MAQNSSQEDDPHVKIRRYKDQLEQVESALVINPSHIDLLAIKNDLLEIIKILTDKLPTDEKKGIGEMNSLPKENKTEFKKAPDIAIAATSRTPVVAKEYIVVKLGNDDESVEKAHISSSSSAHANDINHYLKFRGQVEKMLNYLGQHVINHGLKDAENFLDFDLKKFEKEDLSTQGSAAMDEIAQPATSSASIAEEYFQNTITDRICETATGESDNYDVRENQNVETAKVSHCQNGDPLINDNEHDLFGITTDGQKIEPVVIITCKGQTSKYDGLSDEQLKNLPDEEIINNFEEIRRAKLLPKQINYLRVRKNKYKYNTNNLCSLKKRFKKKNIR